LPTDRPPRALGNRGRQALASQCELPEPTRIIEPVWVEPYPDTLLEAVPDGAPGPDARYEAGEAIALAFVAGLQHLPPHERAVLLLRDVLGFRAGEVAEMLGTSEPSVNSALRRGRATLEARLPVPSEPAPPPDSSRERELLRRFANAFERGDVEAVLELATDDVLVTMPPRPLEYQGREAVSRLLANRFEAFPGGRVTLVPTRANAQPAFGHYFEDPRSGISQLSGLLVLTLSGERVSRLTRFCDTAIVSSFGLPRTCPD
jgi:RNA polymerase sigma-70 factor (ECF subfamily)